MLMTTTALVEGKHATEYYGVAVSYTHLTLPTMCQV